MTPIFRTSVKNGHRAWLYSVVYASKLSLLTVLILFVSLLIQPIHKAIASEDVVEETIEEPGVAEEVKLVEEAVDEEVETEDEIIEEAPEEEVETEDEIVEEPADEEVEVTPVVEKDKASSTANGTNKEDGVEIENGPVTDKATSTNNNGTTTTDSSTGGSGSSSSGDVTDEDEILDEEADSTQSDDVTEEEEESQNDSSAKNASGEEDEDEDEEVEEGPNSAIQELAKETIKQLEYMVNDQNFYQFSKQSCVAVGNGAYHCSESEGAEYDSQSVVYAELGDNGNLEIFLKTSRGKVKQITDNDYDDSSPHYDPNSRRVVWQRLIDDRYQVIMYDIDEEKEYQLTFSRTNNMEPKVSKDGVTWQAWDGADWEIMYFDGKYTDQVTDNTLQDVTPVIEDGYILWSVLGSSEQEARVYSLEDGEMLTITGHEGGSIANPRFVLVYDTKFENGDVVTQGFDPVTGLSAPISAKPAPEPIDIPESDPIGEVRALINNKSSHEDEFIPDDGPDASDTATSTGKVASSTDTLNLKPLTDSPTTTDTIITNDIQAGDDFLQLDEYDLPITFVDLSEDKAAKPSASTTLQVTATST